MIVSVSRRSDVPAFYSEWFFKRIEAGEVLCRNPFNDKQISRIDLKREAVDCFVFWTRNPEPMFERLHLLEGYGYYFQFTLNPYGKDVELNTPRQENALHTFKRLSELIGPRRVVWRYDPILLNDAYTEQRHYETFGFLARELQGFTERCVISFIDDCKACRKNAQTLRLQRLTLPIMRKMAGEFAMIAAQHGIGVVSCAEEVDLAAVGVAKGSCIDPALAAEFGADVAPCKGDSLRPGCLCAPSVDIGAYNSCLHGCLYCYANYDAKAIAKVKAAHDPASPLFTGWPGLTEKICEHHLNKKKKLPFKQGSLW